MINDGSVFIYSPITSRSAFPFSSVLGLGLGFSLRAARVHTSHIYIHICVFLYGFFPLINGMSRNYTR